MDEESGSIQVKHGSSPITASTLAVPNDIFEAECSKNGSVCMPICFLVREQAKSQIAIQGLQKRIHNLEGVQDEVISAISEVQEYLSVSGEHENFAHACSPKSAGSGSGSNAISGVMNRLDVPKASEVLMLSPINPRRSSPRSDLAVSLSFTEAWKSAQKKIDAESSISAQSGHSKFLDGVRGKDTAPESDKQDSGLESDCREHGQDSNPPQHALPPICTEKCELQPTNKGDQDELMELLDEIGEKSEILRQNLSVGEANFEPSPRVSMEMSRMQRERLGLHHMLSSIKGERDVLKSRVEELETTTDELECEKKDLEQRFVTTLVEKHKLEAKLHGYDVAVTASASSNGNLDVISNTSATDGVSKYSPSYHGSSCNSSKKLDYKVNSADVSAVLKETNAIDLQKQVLTYMMENKVLLTKLEQMDQMLSMKDIEKDYLERVHREDIRQYVGEVEQLRLELEEQKIETASLRAKVRVLERALQSVTMENRELNVMLGESMYLKEALQKSRISVQRPTLTSPVTRYSLPAQNAQEDDVAVRCAKSKILPNASSFLDVTVEDPDATDNDLAFTIGPFGFSQRKSSTPLIPSNKREKPNFIDVPSTSSSGLLNPSSFRKSGKRLTFSSMKPLVHSTNFGLSAVELARSKDFHPSAAAAEPSDRPPLRVENSAFKNPELFRDSVNDPKNFPFYTILEKLKASSGYKLPTRSPVREDDGNEGGGAGKVVDTGDKPANRNMVVPSIQNVKNGKSPDRKCNTPAANSPQESGPSKDRKSSSKSLHRRMHNIFDRITAETDDAVI